MQKDKVIQVQNLVARYGEQTILDNVSFDVFKGDIIGIVGTSGCGKSTLLRHLIGLNRPYSGKILLEGTDISECDEPTRQSFFRHMGVLFQGGALFGAMTLAENIALPMLEHTDLTPDVIDKLVHIKLCKFDLASYLDHTPNQLSGGMKKRAGLARAMALNPRFLFLDEPTSGLDPITAAEINTLIRDIKRNASTTIILVTHDIRTIFDVTDRILMLEKSSGKVVADGPPTHLLDQHQPLTVRRFLKNGNP